MQKKSTSLLKLATSNTAILVIDKQNGYIRRAPGDGEVTEINKTLPKVDEFIVKARAQKLPIYWTKMLENRKDSPKNIQLIIKSHVVEDRTFINDSSYDIAGLQPNPEEVIIHKKYYDAFANTDLKHQLTQAGIINLIIIGAYGSRCVLGTCFGANSNDFNVIVLSDLVTNPDNFINELETSRSIIDNILGWTMESSEFFELINKNKQLGDIRI